MGFLSDLIKLPISAILDVGAILNGEDVDHITDNIEDLADDLSDGDLL